MWIRGLGEKALMVGRAADPKDPDFMWREYKQLTDLLIEGDYIGPIRGETNVALNCARFLQCFVKAAEQLLPSQKVQELRTRAFKLRDERWPEDLRW